MLKFYFTIFLIVIFGTHNYSDAQIADKISAKNYFDSENYNLALKQYLKLYEINKEDIEINNNIGVSYLHLNDDKSKAIPYLKFVYNKGGYKEDLLLNLGLAFTYAYKFDEALSFFDDYRKIISSKKAELVENYYEDLQSGKIDYQKKITSGNFSLIEHLIENCESAKELLKSPVNVTFENLGKDVNSKFADFYPYVTKNQEKLYFTSRRDENIHKPLNPQGYFNSDIYVSDVRDGQWTKPKNMGPIVNSDGDEHCVYVMPNGKNMIMFQDNENVIGDIFTVPLLELNQAPPINFKEPVNTAFREFEACITENENILIISSDRSGGFGETDLYMFHKLSNGEWGSPVNLGRQINTKYKEAFPMYDEKNNILYFASEGHTNMGGFDIFKSQFDPVTEKFEPAENIGYPINTPDNEMVFSLADNNRDGYISAVINGGFGDLDIYKVVFNEIENRPSVIRGILSQGDSSANEINAVVSLIDAKTNKMIDSKNVNPQSGRYIFAVEPGRYILKASSPDYIDFKDEISVFDKSDYVFEIEKNILLQKIIVDSSISINPIPKTDLKKPTKTIIRGVVSTNDSLQDRVDAFVSILDAKTKKTLEGKTANTQSGRYFFVLDPGMYILMVSSKGYINFEQEINIDDKSGTLMEIEKNIQLLKNQNLPPSDSEHPINPPKNSIKQQ